MKAFYFIAAILSWMISAFAIYFVDYIGVGLENVNYVKIAIELIFITLLFSFLFYKATRKYDKK